MEMNEILSTTLGLAACLLAVWTMLIATLMIARPRGLNLGEAFQLLPATLVLLHGLARDPEVSTRTRVLLAAALAYLAMPFDLVPDFIPVVGQADDIIVVILILRSALRDATPEAFQRHWQGSADGLRALLSLIGREQSLP